MRLTKLLTAFLMCFVALAAAFTSVSASPSLLNEIVISEKTVVPAVAPFKPAKVGVISQFRRETRTEINLITNIAEKTSFNQSPFLRISPIEIAERYILREPVIFASPPRKILRLESIKYDLPPNCFGFSGFGYNARSQI